jgi:hypothetical protein
MRAPLAVRMQKLAADRENACVTQLTRIALTADEAALVSRATIRLERLLAASDAVVSPVSERPLPGSLMARAQDERLGDAYDLAYLLLFAAEDHLRTLLWVVRAGMLPAFAFYTLLRAAADASVRCRHLAVIVHADR